MKKIMNWVLAATLVCGTMAFMTGCKKSTVQETTVQECLPENIQQTLPLVENEDKER